MVGMAEQLEAREPNMRKIGQIKLPLRSETIVRVPVTPRSPLVGMTNKCELQEGVILAVSRTKVVDGYVMKSILNNNDTEVDMHQSLVELDEVDRAWNRRCGTEFESQDREREREILTQLRLEHLNTEERKLLVQAGSDYQDIFYLPGDELSSSGAARHSISVEP
jgi:hypothetical protein